nr:MAG TPA: hypothetical protein [Caudoviricetes sp.]
MVAEYIFLYEEKLCHRKRRHDFCIYKKFTDSNDTCERKKMANS